jgi:hypothetical protein
MTYDEILALQTGGGGNDGLMEREENIKAVSLSSHSPWKSPKSGDYHIPTARRLL